LRSDEEDFTGGLPAALFRAEQETEIIGAGQGEAPATGQCRYSLQKLSSDDAPLTHSHESARAETLHPTLA
jgi:hypothetical protein